MASEDKHEDKDHWIQVQKKTFTKWVNNHLRRKKFSPIEDPQTAFEDGVALMHLVNALYDVQIPKYNTKPTMRPHKLDNINLALKMVEDANIKTNFLKNTHLVDHDLKMLLGMIWAIILDYAIKGISVDEMTAKEGLLLWCRKKTAGYRDVDPPGVQNFSTSWKNGLALCALIHRHRPDLIEYDSLNKADDAKNLELAFSVAENHLDIPRLLDVEDLTAVARPDEKSVMTYISEFFHRFASQDIKEQAARRVQRFLNFALDIEKQQKEYESRAGSLIEWARTTANAMTEGKFGDTVEFANQLYGEFRSFLVSEKPTKAAEKLDVETLYAEIQTELAVNNRRPYVPPAECTVDTIEVAWGQLNTAEYERGKALREFRFKFIEKKESVLPQEKIDEFTAAFHHFDKNKNQTLDKVEFKAALVSLGVPFGDDESFNKVFLEVSEGAPVVNLDQYIRYNKRLAEDKDTPDQVKASFQIMADQKDTITDQQLRTHPLNAPETEYLQTHLPQVSDGVFDYRSYVDSLFAAPNA